MRRRTSGCSWRSGCGRGVGPERYDRPGGFLLPFLQIGADLLEVEIELLGVLLPVLSDFLDDRVTPGALPSRLHGQFPFRTSASGVPDLRHDLSNRTEVRVRRQQG